MSLFIFILFVSFSFLPHLFLDLSFFLSPSIHHRLLLSTVPILSLTNPTIEMTICSPYLANLLITISLVPFDICCVPLLGVGILKQFTITFIVLKERKTLPNCHYVLLHNFMTSLLNNFELAVIVFHHYHS